MRAGIRSGEGRREGAKQIVGARACAMPEQKPCSLQVLNGRDPRKQPVVFITLGLQLALDVRLTADGGTENDEALLGLRERPIPDPPPSCCSSATSRGSSPAAFQIRVLPKLISTRACTQSAAR